MVLRFDKRGSSIIAGILFLQHMVTGCRECVCVCRCVCVCVQVCAGAELLRENIVLMLLMIVGNQWRWQLIPHAPLPSTTSCAAPHWVSFLLKGGFFIPIVIKWSFIQKNISNMLTFSSTKFYLWLSAHIYTSHLHIWIVCIQLFYSVGCVCVCMY